MDMGWGVMAGKLSYLLFTRLFHSPFPLFTVGKQPIQTWRPPSKCHFRFLACVAHPKAKLDERGNLMYLVFPLKNNKCMVSIEGK